MTGLLEPDLLEPDLLDLDLLEPDLLDLDLLDFGGAGHARFERCSTTLVASL